MATVSATSRTLQSALYYASRGWHVFPVRGKVPLKGSSGFKDASLTPSAITEWFTGHPDYGVAIATGVSGIVVVDVDVKDGQPGIASWEALTAGIDVSGTLHARTPSGGYHYYFAIPDGVIVESNSNKLAPGIDIRGHGGYVVAPPSPGYRWGETGNDPKPIPPKLLDAILSAQEGTTKATTTPTRAKAKRGSGAIPKGSRNDVLFRTYAARLRRITDSEAVILAALEKLNEEQCRPPLPQAEVAKVARSVMRYDCDEQATTGADNPHFEALGVSGEKLCLLDKSSGQIRRVEAARMTKGWLYGLAPRDYWRLHYGDPETGRIDWDGAIDTLITGCKARGFFSDSQVRSTGVWMDDGRVVVNHGGHMTVDGAETSHRGIDSQYWYAQGADYDSAPVQPATVADCAPMVDLCQGLGFRKRSDWKLLLGWLMGAPIAGCLDWRPHVWLTGAAGTGKTWVIDHVVYPALGPGRIGAQSETTEAGIRQTLQNRSLPVVIDELDVNSPQGLFRIQQLVGLARAASANSGAPVRKGSAHGDAQTYSVESAFLFASVRVAITGQADLGRFSVLELAPHNRNTEARLATIVKLNAMARRVTKADYASIRARSRALAHVARDNALVFAVAASEALGSERAGQQLGALLGAYWLTQSDTVATLEQARAEVQSGDWCDYATSEEAPDEAKLLNTLLTSTVRHEAGALSGNRSIGELAEAWVTTDRYSDEHRQAQDTLRRNGFAPTSGGLAIANNHAQLGLLLRNTVWSCNWSRTLARLDGAEAQGAGIRFAGVRSRCVVVPWQLVVDCDGVDGEAQDRNN